MTIVDDMIATQLLELERMVPQPSGELGYGTDLSCVLDADDEMSEVDPLSPLAIGQALLRRLITRSASIVDAPNYGFDVRAFVNRGVPVTELRDLGGRIQQELAKDDRVTSVTCTVTQRDQTTLNIAISVVPAVIGLAPFTLIFAVTSGAATLELIGG